MPRYAVKISKEELEEKIIQAIKNHEDYDEEIFKDMFGDHVEVVVTRNGTEIEEYTDHD